MRTRIWPALLAALLAAPAAAQEFPSAASGFPGAAPEFLHPDEAFRLSLAPEAGGRALVRFEVADGYYLYRDQTQFSTPSGGVSYALPAGKVKDDPLFGTVQVYYRELLVPLTVSPPDAEELVVQYQGCAEAGVCYPLQTRTLRLAGPSALLPDLPSLPDLPDLPELPDFSSLLDFSALSGLSELSEADQIALDLGRRSLWLSFLVFIGFGLLLAFTPCVLPLLPILASVIAGDAQPGTRRALLLSLVYVLGLASVYALLGLGVGLTGANIQPYLQNIWVLGAFSVVLVLLALGMFGAFELRLPAALDQGLQRINRSVPGGSYVGAAVLGALAALIATPCVSPALVGALLYIADAGDPARGALSLFGMGLGLGLPLLAFGAAQGRFLPKSGAWMVGVRAVFGFLLLALAIWMLDRVVPGRLVLMLSGMWLIAVGVWLRALDPLPRPDDGVARAGKGFGFAALIYGAVLLSGGAMGGERLLQPWPLGAGGASAPAEKAYSADSVSTVAELQRALQDARGRPAMLYVYADWCVTCRELEAFTFPDEAVQRALSGVVRLGADVTDNNTGHRRLLEHLNLFGPPGLVFYDATGAEARALRVVGYVDAERLVGMLARLGAPPA